MNEVTFKKKSWHRRFYDATYKSASWDYYNEEYISLVPVNICPYFRRIMFGILMLPLSFIGYHSLMQKAINSDADMKDKFSGKVLFTLLFWLIAGLFTVTGSACVLSWGLPVWTAWFSVLIGGFTCITMTGTAFGLGYLIYRIAEWKKRRDINKRYEPDKPQGLFASKLKSVHDKICPHINWEE